MSRVQKAVEVDYCFAAVWQCTTPELRQEIADFWLRNGALSSAEKAHQRASQAIITMRESNGVLVAVSSAVLSVIPRLQQPLYYYRTFCAEAHRGNGTSIAIMKASQQALHDYNLGLPEPEAIGMHIEVENDMIAKHYPQAHWPQTGFRFIGYSPQGHVVRAYYFPGFALKPRHVR